MGGKLFHRATQSVLSIFWQTIGLSNNNNLKNVQKLHGNVDQKIVARPVFRPSFYTGGVIGNNIFSLFLIRRNAKICLFPIKRKYEISLFPITGGVDDKNIQKSLVCSYCKKKFCVIFKEPKKSKENPIFLYVP